ncbi:MAG TPA: 3,4-dihydroxy-2-butanone-4-phosphate synthase [Candidatus Kryptonia bacterium]|nr:3,4-dihydroxy-2-butanone-4-phosphate synthase [Candidatus Kryptonia bacterium]
MFTSFREPPKRARRISPIEDAIADLKAGKMVILMDDENRENEGDLCLAAEKTTPEAINFMTKYARGLICLALTEARIRDLGLNMMVAENRAPLGTAFTVSIDARRGITNGVSAVDRAVTIQTAVRDGTRPEDLTVPGHIFPLRARNGGVLVRTGQTEGVVDLARLAGLKPAGVICEIMKEDGTMARLPDLERFAAAHGLKLCTVADLVQYRLRCDSLVHRVAEARIRSRYGGEFRAYVYHTDVDDGEHLVLVKGELRPDEPVLVRAHAEYLPGDVFGLVTRNTGALVHQAMEAIAKEGRGVLVYLRREGRGAELHERTALGRRLHPREDARRPSTDPRAREMDFREYGIGAQILRDVGVGKIRLLTNYPRRMVSLPGYGLEIVECVPLNLPATQTAKPVRPARRRPSPARKVAPIR